MPPAPVPAPVIVPPSAFDRLLAAVDRVRHPRLTRELARATDGFHANGVVRRYENAEAGRRRERLEGPILWHRGYRPPTLLTHNAIWITGGPVIDVGYHRELVPAFRSERAREVAERLGVGRGSRGA